MIHLSFGEPLNGDARVILATAPSSKYRYSLFSAKSKIIACRKSGSLLRCRL